MLQNPDERRHLNILRYHLYEGYVALYMNTAKGAKSRLLLTFGPGLPYCGSAGYGGI